MCLGNSFAQRVTESGLNESGAMSRALADVQFHDATFDGVKYSSALHFRRHRAVRPIGPYLLILKAMLLVCHSAHLLRGVYSPRITPLLQEPFSHPPPGLNQIPSSRPAEKNISAKSFLICAGLGGASISVTMRRPSTMFLLTGSTWWLYPLSRLLASASFSS